MVRATDPPGFGDYIRYFTKRNSQPFLPPTNSAYDDLFVDGTTYELPVNLALTATQPSQIKTVFFSVEIRS
jgi:hypothetical protein